MTRTMNYFILGTDTGVGKTVLSFLFMTYFFRIGKKPFYIKPFQTGCVDAQSPESDARFIYSNVPELQGQDPSLSVIYCLPQPKAPYYAAMNKGLTLDPDFVSHFINAKQQTHSPIIVEAAGGIFVPVTEKALIIDLLQIIDVQPVVAARAGLGTINHTLLTLHALKTRGFKKPSVVFVSSGHDDPSMISENMAAIETFSGIRVAGVVPFIADFTRIPSPCLDVVKSALKP